MAQHSPKTTDENSSITRVCPAFTVIKDNPAPFFRLLRQECDIVCDPYGERIREIRFAGKSKAEPTEKGLPPTKEYLLWLLDNLDSETIRKECAAKDKKSSMERLKLIDENKGKGQTNLAKKFIKKLDDHKPQNGWFVFEGSSKPDVFIRTDNFLLVVEGKRTEAGPKIGTVWNPHRHQIIRHIENLRHFAQTKYKSLPCYGIFIVEESKVGQYDLDQYFHDKPYEESLRHLDGNFKGIKDSYKGHLTWQQLWEVYRQEKHPIRYVKRIEYYRDNERPCD